MAAALLGAALPLEARTRKGDKYLAEGRMAETKKEWDAALESYEKALSEDPADIVYRMAADKARFQASQAHVDAGMKLRDKGQLGDAMLEFQKAWAINPGSAVAQQEIVRTQDMILRERRLVEATGKPSDPAERSLTPAEIQRRETQEKLDRLLPVPELKPLNPDAIRNGLKINGQPVKTVFDTIGKVAGINVLWDPEFNSPPRNINVDFTDSTLEQALDYVSTITKTYWKPLSPNTIFITNDNPNKRRDYEEMVVKTFYLSNIQTPQEIQEVVNAIRAVSELQRVVPYNSQNAIIVRGEADKVALAEKMIMDMDKAKAEVVVDILVMEASSVFSRQLTAAIASTGLNVPVGFTPRSSLTTPDPKATSDEPGTTTLVPLNKLHLVNGSDFSLTLPGALLQAAMSDTKTKVLQAPQLRSVDGAKAILKIGEREPTATGSFQPGIGGVGINPLVNTQFTYIDVGVNVELTPRVHENGDVSMHVDLDISTVAGHVNLGGIDQPIIGQRKVTHDIRMHEGEVNLLGGLISQQEDKQMTGIPGLSSIPVLRRLFSGESTGNQRKELMIVLVPHIVRRPDFTASNLRTIAAGTTTAVKLNYAPRETPAGAASGNPPAAAANPPVPAAAVETVPAQQPPATAPATTPVPAPEGPALAPPATAPPAAAPPATTPREAAAAPTGANIIRVNPTQVSTSTSSVFTVTIGLEGATDVGAMPIRVQFDPRMVRLNDAVRGDFLSSDGQPALFTKNILNDAGTATLDITRLPRAAGVSGSGPVITLQFQALGRGNSTITLPNLSVRNSQGQVIATATPQISVITR